MARLVLDTFPKSGSAFTAAALELVFPHDEMVWGEQRRANLRDADNCLTIARDPRDAAPSCMIFMQYDDPRAVLDWYCRFMEWTYLYQDRIHIALFENVTTKPMHVLTSYAERFGLQATHVSDQSIYARTRETHPLHLPAPTTPQRLAANEAVASCDLLPDALAIFEKVKSVVE